VVAEKRDGVDRPRNQFTFNQLTFRGEVVIVQTNTGEQEMSFRVNPAPNPKRIDMRVKASWTQIFYGLYSLDGDTLIICQKEKPNLYRPAELTSNPNSGNTLITAKRVTS
jgi:uncharacterized protein (TIGR03067 family)